MRRELQARVVQRIAHAYNVAVFTWSVAARVTSGDDRGEASNTLVQLGPNAERCAVAFLLLFASSSCYLLAFALVSMARAVFATVTTYGWKHVALIHSN